MALGGLGLRGNPGVNGGAFVGSLEDVRVPFVLAPGGSQAWEVFDDLCVSGPSGWIVVFGDDGGGREFGRKRRRFGLLRRWLIGRHEELSALAGRDMPASDGGRWVGGWRFGWVDRRSTRVRLQSVIGAFRSAASRDWRQVIIEGSMEWWLVVEQTKATR